MDHIRTQIQHAAPQNAALLNGLHETDSAPSQLSQQNAYIADLDSQIRQTAAHVSRLKKATQTELKDHKKYSESTFRRLAHKAAGQRGKFADKAAKEEREYFDAIQEQKTGEDQLAYLEHLKSEAETERQHFEHEAQRHEQFQAHLDALYDSIFSGPTPGFPEEDERESACVSASQTVQHLSQQLERERHLVFLLGQVSQRLAGAARYLDSAHHMSQVDMFCDGATISMQKRNYLEKAESCIQSVRMLQSQIQQVQPDGSAHLGEMNIASGSIWGDVIFDTIFSDMDMHEKIKNSEAQIKRAGQKLGQVIRVAQVREKSLRGELKGASNRLRKTRKELQTARENAFAGISQGRRTQPEHESMDGTGDDAGGPPAYEAIGSAPPAYDARG
ncbi:hypothetical protein K504DRAFT_465611 [Pleomassaria siparia CBS 279.74]|uniref:Uncharacterized protein n=1 Tax=Pleomassaria siparia CBS 279.74 TaxID=1314801 RepID=A0A6G1KGW3_9PLEO|nr:hypothetical protein K504DRAFT_465611 [Pleomassaria siparia CBS 279.74]